MSFPFTDFSRGRIRESPLLNDTIRQGRDVLSVEAFHETSLQIWIEVHQTLRVSVLDLSPPGLEDQRPMKRPEARNRIVLVLSPAIRRRHLRAARSASTSAITASASSGRGGTSCSFRISRARSLARVNMSFLPNFTQRS